MLNLSSNDQLMEHQGHGMGYVIALVLLLLIAIPLLIIWVKTVIEISQSNYPDGTKIIWLLLVLLGGILGIVLYYLIGRKKRINAHQQEDLRE